ncbi:hypothetical protein PSPO01_11745 [Paraphaeosphaeria sporulosa]
MPAPHGGASRPLCITISSLCGQSSQARLESALHIQAHAVAVCLAACGRHGTIESLSQYRCSSRDRCLERHV